MPSTPTTNLRLELQATGENDDTWGTKNNVNLQLLENAISKRQAITLSASNVTLTTTNYADDQARSMCLALTGVLTANVAVIVPSLSKLYVVDNRTTGSFSVTVRTSGGTGVVCRQNAATMVMSDATNVVSLETAAADAQTLDGLDSAEFARIASFNQFAAGSGHTFVTVADGATVDVDCTLSDRFIVTLGGNRTLALSSPSDGQEIHIWIVQDGTGGRTLTLPANVSTPGGVAPTLSTIGGSVDVFKLGYNTARDEWELTSSSGSSGGATFNVTSSGNEQDVHLFSRVGSPSGAATVNYIVTAGTIISASSTVTPALDLSGFASGSTINVINHGYILGGGGKGGNGAGIFDQGAGLSGAYVRAADSGEAGGNALLGSGSGITVNVYNADGFIWGGGGGGGGGGTAAPSAACTANGGGGGGGVGGGQFGRGNKAGNGSYATDGGRAGAGVNATVGAGGAGNGSSATGGAGGGGGDWGTAGTNGTTPAPSASNLAAGSGGAAGKAIEFNGGSVTVVTGSGSPNIKGAVS